MSSCVFGAGRLPIWPGRNLRVLRLHGRGHVGHGQLVAVELHRIDPDPHRILRPEQLEAADAVHSGDGLLDLGGHHVSKVVLVVGAVGRIKTWNEREIGRRFLDPHALALNLLRQEGERGLDLVVDLYLRGIGVGALLEGQCHRDLARRRGLRREIAQMVDALQLLLDDLGRRLVEGRGVRAWEDCCDADLGRGKRRELRDWQRASRQQSEQHHQDREDPGKDRPVDEIARHEPVSGRVAVRASPAFPDAPAGRRRR